MHVSYIFLYLKDINVLTNTLRESIGQSGSSIAQENIKHILKWLAVITKQDRKNYDAAYNSLLISIQADDDAGDHDDDALKLKSFHTITINSNEIIKKFTL